MPELPEVEVTKNAIAHCIHGATITAVELGKPLRMPLYVDPRELVGRRIMGLGRRGKYLVFTLSEGVLLVHLGMSGSLSFLPSCSPPGKHDHFTLLTDVGCVRLHDPRRFGAVVFSASMDVQPAFNLVSRLGMEPLSGEFPRDTFVQAIRAKRSPVKQVLLAGQVVVGVGNIYASEALFTAGIHPASRADRVSVRRLQRLHDAIRSVLAEAVKAGGTTLRDFRDPNGNKGHFQTATKVYGRVGLPCVECGKPIQRLVQGQRSTYYCAVCQVG